MSRCSEHIDKLIGQAARINKVGCAVVLYENIGFNRQIKTIFRHVEYFDISVFLSGKTQVGEKCIRKILDTFRGKKPRAGVRNRFLPVFR